MKQIKLKNGRSLFKTYIFFRSAFRNRRQSYAHSVTTWSFERSLKTFYGFIILNNIQQ